jgi:hypothetical protein
MKMFEIEAYRWINLDQVVQARYSVNNLLKKGFEQTRHALVVYLAVGNQVEINAPDVIIRFMIETNAPGWKPIAAPNPSLLLVSARGAS